MRKHLPILLGIAAILAIASLVTLAAVRPPAAPKATIHICHGWLYTGGSPDSGATVTTYPLHNEGTFYGTSGSGGYFECGGLPYPWPTDTYFLCATKSGKWYHTQFSYSQSSVNLGNCNMSSGAHPSHPIQDY